MIIFGGAFSVFYFFLGGACSVLSVLRVTNGKMQCECQNVPAQYIKVFYFKQARKLLFPMTSPYTATKMNCEEESESFLQAPQIDTHRLSTACIRILSSFCSYLLCPAAFTVYICLTLNIFSLYSIIYINLMSECALEGKRGEQI